MARVSGGERGEIRRRGRGRQAVHGAKEYWRCTGLRNTGGARGKGILAVSVDNIIGRRSRIEPRPGGMI